MRKIFSLLAIFTFIFFNSTQVNAQEELARIKSENELVVGLTGTQPPYCMLTKDSSYIGFEVDLAQSIADRMGVKLRIKAMPFSELLPALKAGEIDLVMSGMTMTSERNMEVAFVGPYYNSGKTILTFAQVYADVQDTEELNKGSVKIATLKGSTSEAYVNENMPKAKNSPQKDYESAIKLLNEEKVGLILAETAVIRYEMMLFPDAGFVTLEEPFNYEPIGLGLLPKDFSFP